MTLSDRTPDQGEAIRSQLILPVGYLGAITMTDLVSILIPAYNAEKWIAETINSAISQTWPKKEIIVVDDGSRDNTLAIARQFESKSVKVLSQQNRGASAARNKALEHARGDYIQWLDADDLLAQDKISEQLKGCGHGQSSRVLLTSVLGSFFFRPHRAKVIPNPLWRDLLPVEWLLVKFNENVWMNPAAFLVSRRLSDLAGPWNGNLSLDDDGEYFARVVAASEQVCFKRGARSYYRVGNYGSLSQSVSIAACRSFLTSQLLSIRLLLSLEDTERSKQVCLRYLQRSFYMYYPEMDILVDEAKDLARHLGGELVPPQLSWKYSLIQNLLGWKMAKASQRWVPRVKVLGLRMCDGALYGLERSFEGVSRSGGRSYPVGSREKY